jgi:hypothetical protein
MLTTVWEAKSADTWRSARACHDAAFGNYIAMLSGYFPFLRNSFTFPSCWRAIFPLVNIF